jgi:hypothetical protein
MKLLKIKCVFLSAATVKRIQIILFHIFFFKKRNQILVYYVTSFIIIFPGYWNVLGIL